MSKRSKPTLPVTNRHALSRHEREARFRRALYIGAGVFAALILGVLAFGLYQTYVVEPASPVATVNGVTIRTDTYQRWVQYRRYEMGQSLAWIDAQLAQLNSEDANEQSLYTLLVQQRNQLQNQAMSLGLTALEDLIDNELIRQEAARRGITVSGDEVQREIEQEFGYNIEQPTPAPTVAAAGEAVTETETVTTTPAPTATLAPTATPMTQEEFNERYTAAMQNLQEGAGFTEADYRALVEIRLLGEKLQEVMAAEVPTTAEQVHARHILVSTEEEAKAALERIRNGEDFAAVAQEVSTDSSNKDQGGDLGWFPRGYMVSEFETAAFALQPGQISDVVQTSFGYHIIKVEERQADRALEESMLSQKRSSALTDWLSAQRESEGVQRFWSSSKVPPIAQ